MRGALLFLAVGACGALVFDALLAPFLGALLREFGVHPEEWAGPVAEAVRSQRTQIAVAGAAGALTGVFVRHFVEGWRSRNKPKEPET